MCNSEPAETGRLCRKLPFCLPSRYTANVNKDGLTKERRSWNMSRIRGKNTTPEMRVRSLLHRLGFRFRLHVRITLSASNGESDRVRCRIPRAVSVDILLPKYKTAIFVHGCFWHRHRGCKNCTTPTNRRDWWLAKLNGNAARDKVHQRALRKLGWRSAVVWECETENPEKLARSVTRLIRRMLLRVRRGVQSLPARARASGRTSRPKHHTVP